VKRYRLIIRRNGEVRRKITLKAKNVCVDGYCIFDSAESDWKPLKYGASFTWELRVPGTTSVRMAQQTFTTVISPDVDCPRLCPATPKPPTKTPTRTLTRTPSPRPPTVTPPNPPTNTSTRTPTNTPESNHCGERFVTCTPVRTFTPTQTYTPRNTLIPTVTLTFTPLPPTLPPTNTRTPSRTPTATQTFTSAPTLCFEPTLEPTVCNGAGCQSGGGEARMSTPEMSLPMTVPICGQTPTFTPAISPTPIPSNTLVPTPTQTPTRTPTATQTFTPVPTLCFEPTLEPTACNGVGCPSGGGETRMSTPEMPLPMTVPICGQTPTPVTPTATPSATSVTCQQFTPTPVCTGVCPESAPQAEPRSETCNVLTATPTSTPSPIVLLDCVVEIQLSPQSTVDRVNVRDVPQGSIIGVLFPGQRLIMSAEENGWYMFFAGGVRHWFSTLGTHLVVSGDCNNLPSASEVTTPSYEINPGVYCLYATIPTSVLEYCKDEILDNVYPIYQALNAQLGIELQIDEIIAITIDKEWWAYESFISQTTNIQLKSAALEGNSRNYFQFCGQDGCTLTEKLWFMSGYQPWRISSGGTGFQDTLDALTDSYLRINQLEDSDFHESVDFALNPIDTTWQSGISNNRPWQWFNRNTSTTRPTEGMNPCNQVYLRNAGVVFEIYTYHQDYQMKNGDLAQCATPTLTP